MESVKFPAPTVLRGLNGLILNNTKPSDGRKQDPLEQELMPLRSFPRNSESIPTIQSVCGTDSGMWIWRDVAQNREIEAARFPRTIEGYFG